MQKSQHIEHPVTDLIKNRKSVRAFSTSPIEQIKINSLFEATRWAPSSTNEQPWIYIYATKDQPELWNKLFHYFSLNKEKFLERYHQRSNSETAFSMITVVSHLKHLRHRVADYLWARLAYLAAMFNTL